ncbi:MAG: hypothetical protein ACK521_02145 [bacterium]
MRGSVDSGHFKQQYLSDNQGNFSNFASNGNRNSESPHEVPRY